MNIDHVLITGGAGYLGSVLVPELLAAGYRVTVLDNFRHGVPSLLGCIRDEYLQELSIVRGDASNTATLKPLIEPVDAVVALAAIVGAPACDLEYREAVQVNVRAIQQLGRLIGGRPLIYPCTNSGYGIGGEAECDENSPLLPISRYGRTKVVGERLALATQNGISLRFATLFGPSPRMRLDLMVNDFVYRAVRNRALVVFEGGFRRNFLHVADAARAIRFALEHVEAMRGLAFNVGDSRANMTKLDLCRRIAQHVPGFTWVESAAGTDPDKRDYVVSNARIEALGWRPQCTLEEGIHELLAAYRMPLEGPFRNV